MEDRSKHFIGPVAQKAIIERDGKILLTKGIGDGETWELPGGRLHLGEDPLEGLKREILEELGVSVIFDRVVHIEQFLHRKSNQNHLLIAYKVRLADDNRNFAPDASEVEDMRWIERSQLYEQPIFDNCLRALEAYFR